VSSPHPQILWFKLILSISPVQSQPVRSEPGGAGQRVMVVEDNVEVGRFAT
jgi:hypothetical protein